MKKVLFLLVAVLSTVSVFAQDDEKKAAEAALATEVKSTEISDSAKHWKFTGMVGLNASETMLFNWAAGGNNNVTGVVFANLTLSYKKNKLAWDSNLDTEFGELFSSDLNPKLRKSNDKININSKLGYKLAKSWYLSLLGSFKSQYANGYEYANNEAGDKKLISSWASPSYTDLSIGVDYMPNDIFTIFVSPVAGRLTTCRVDSLRANYGVPVDKSYTAALGFSAKAGVNYTKIKNLKIISSVTLFTPYTSKVQRFGSFDVDWDFAISYNFFKCLNVSLMTSLKYYDQVMIAPTEKQLMKDPTEHARARVQFKEMVGLGISYSF